MPFPSTEQSIVIGHRTGPLIVVAGPGTGKTRTLVQRMISLLAEDRTREVTFITFTRASRSDTQRKLEIALGESVVDQPGLMFPRTSTLHTYAKRLVHRYASVISRQAAFSILIDDKGEKALLLEEVIADLGLSMDLATLKEALTCYRGTTEWPPGFSLDASDRLAVLARFDLLLALYRTLDMEGVVLAACEILGSTQAPLPRLFLQVDEYQDLNPMDQRFINLAASHPLSEVVVVGDDAQSIYGFRHAHPAGLRSLWESAEWKPVRFADSFRLPSHILNAALDLLCDSDYVGAQMNRKPGEERRILALQCTKPDLQIAAVARGISELVKNANENPGSATMYSDMLVLCPTGTQVQRVAKHLAETCGIPTRTPVKTTIPDDYWSIILLLRVLEHQDPLAFRQWLPLLGFSPDEITQLRDESMATSVSFFDHCLASADERIARFRSDLDQVRDSAGNPEQLYPVLSSVDGVCVPEDFIAFLLSLLDEDGNLPPLGQLVQIIYRRFGVLEGDEVISDEDSVLVATMHGAKGLEAEFVYCLWMNAKYMPMPSRDPIEERRVMYVALTRAKQDVVLAFHEEFHPGRGLLGQAVMSPFMREISDHLRILRVTAGDIRSPSFCWGVEQ